MRRILVTGSRGFADRLAVETTLRNTLRDPRTGDVVVHGACPNSPDNYAAAWCAVRDIAQERHPADWQAHGKAAGFIRNQEMVDAGADLCLAFWDGESRGTLDCITRAVKAGIVVRIIPKERSPSPWLTP
jgi:hypothetical protein